MVHSDLVFRCINMVIFCKEDVNGCISHYHFVKHHRQRSYFLSEQTAFDWIISSPSLSFFPMQYIVECHGITLLPQFLGMYRLNVDGVEIYVIVTRNVFSHRLSVYRKYDLKVRFLLFCSLSLFIHVVCN